MNLLYKTGHPKGDLRRIINFFQVFGKSLNSILFEHHSFIFEVLHVSRGVVVITLGCESKGSEFNSRRGQTFLFISFLPSTAVVSMVKKKYNVVERTRL